MFVKYLPGKFSYEFNKGKFYKDEIIIDNSKYTLLIKGVILNKSQILINNKEEKWENAILKIVAKNENDFFKQFKGSFCGVLFNKHTKKLLAFTNQIGDQKLFYTKIPQGIIISNSYSKITDFYKKNKLKLTLDKTGVYYLLTYGFMLDEKTLLKEIKRLTAGKYLNYTNKQIIINQYFDLSNIKKINIKEDEIIDIIDNYFRKAVQLEFNKDLEYGFAHISSLSGGLDSRMTNWVANNLGYNNIFNITFSQYGYSDMTIAQKLSDYLNQDWLFRALNNGNYLKNIDDTVNVTLGLTSYHASAHSLSTLKLLNLKSFGLIHTGQLGDVTIGSYSIPYDININSYKYIKGLSTKLINKIPPPNLYYEDFEKFTYYTRGLNGILSGNFTMQEFTEASSPFLDIDLLKFCFSIPYYYRNNHQVYIKWIKKKYSDAGKFKWEAINAKLTDKMIIINNKNIAIKQLPLFIIEGVLHRLKLNKIFIKKSHMNPFEYWFNKNNSLTDYLNDYYNKNINFITDKELKDDCIMLFQHGSEQEKFQVLTLLSFIKNFLE